MGFEEEESFKNKTIISICVFMKTSIAYEAPFLKKNKKYLICCVFQRTAVYKVLFFLKTKSTFYAAVFKEPQHIMQLFSSFFHII